MDDKDVDTAHGQVVRAAFTYKVISAITIAALSAGLMWAASTISSSSDKIIRIEKDVEYIFRILDANRIDIKDLQRSPASRR